MLRVVLLFCLIVFSVGLYAQSEIREKYDALQGKIKSPETDVNTKYHLFHDQLALLENSKEYDLYCETLLNLGTYWKRRPNGVDSSKFYIEKAQQFCLQKDLPEWFWKAEQVYVGLYTSLGEYDSARVHVDKMINASRLAGDSSGVAWGFAELSLICYNENNYPESLSLALKSKDYWEKLTEQQKEAFDPWTALASVYVATGKPEKALSPLQNIIDDALAKESYSLAAQWSLQKANAYRMMSDSSNMLLHLKNVLKYGKQAKHARLIGISCAFLIDHFIQYEMIDSAKFYENDLRAHVPVITEPYVLAQLTKNRGAIAVLEENWSDAIEQYESALQMYKKLKAKGVQQEISSKLYEAYLKQDDYKNALKYHLLHTEFKDSILSKSKIEELKEIELTYEFEKQRISDSLLTVQKNGEIESKHQLDLAKEKEAKTFLLFGLIGLGLIIAFVVFALVRKRKQAKLLNTKNREIQQTLHEKQLLLKEVHHRVKNNFQLVSSLLELQSKGIEDEKAKALAREGQNRVKSMAFIHQKLYQNDDLLIHFDDYLNRLIQEISVMYGKNKEVSVRVESANYSFDIDTAIPLGLIVNELVTNSYKYGFAETGKELNVWLEKTQDQDFKLTVKDNGIGLPDAFDFAKAESLGLRLVRLLSRQLHGKVIYSNDDGCSFSIYFKDTKARMLVD